MTAPFHPARRELRTRWYVVGDRPMHALVSEEDEPTAGQSAPTWQLPIVLVHGLGMAAESMRPLGGELAAPAYRVYASEAIEEVARQTAEEIDHMVGTLREGGSPNGSVEAPAGLASLDALIAHHRDAGLEIALDVSGPRRRLGAAVDQAAYRILQEALTNAARHGAGRAAIRLALGDEAVELSVTNPMPTPRRRSSTMGHGLIGMRERATLLGGSLEAESANGLFCIRARIPNGGHRN